MKLIDELMARKSPATERIRVVAESLGFSSVDDDVAEVEPPMTVDDATYELARAILIEEMGAGSGVREESLVRLEEARDVGTVVSARVGALMLGVCVAVVVARGCGGRFLVRIADLVVAGAANTTGSRS